MPPIIQKHLIHLIKQLWVLSFKATRRYFKCFIIILSLWFLKKCSVGACEQGLEVVNTAANNKKFCQTFFSISFSIYLFHSLFSLIQTHIHFLPIRHIHRDRKGVSESENLVFELDSIEEISWSCLYLHFIASLMPSPPSWSIPIFSLFSKKSANTFLSLRPILLLL